MIQIWCYAIPSILYSRKTTEMSGKITAKTLEDELSLAIALLKDNWGLEFQRPAIAAGEKYRNEFFNIRTKEDYWASLHVLMVYRDAENRIFVPDIVSGTSGLRDPADQSAERIFSFIHECTHAYHSYINPALRSARLTSLAENRFRMIREMGYVYEVFSEGAATYTSIRTALASDRPALKEYGKGYHEDIIGSWDRWRTKFLPLAAETYGLEDTDLRAVLYAYLWRESNSALLTHRYHLGYTFMSEIAPEPELFRKMSMTPPSIIEHLVYPETYLKGLDRPLD